MDSFATLTIFFGFYVVFCYCLDLLEAIANTTTQSLAAAAAALAQVPAVLTTLVLTPLLVYAHVRELGRANTASGGGGAGARFVARLAKATFLAAAVALLSGVAVRLGLGVDGVLGLGGADDVGWLNNK